MEKYGFIYLWRDKKHKRYYIGCHWGTIDDGYICSSTWMKNSYKRRPHDFKRKVLETNITKEELLTKEHKWLQLIKEKELGVKYYNLHRYHFGHWHSDPRSTLTVKQKLSEASKRLHQDPIYKQKFIEGRKNLPKHTKEQIERRLKSRAGYKHSDETKKKIGQSNLGKIKGPLSEETKQKLREGMVGEKNPFYGKTHTPECRAIMGAKISKAMKGKIPKNIAAITGLWWNNGIKNKRNPECPGDGWIRGILK